MNSSSGFQLFMLLSFLLLLLFVAEVRARRNTFNVVDNGARGDGQTNNTKAFYNTWNQTCQFRGRSLVMVPEGKFLVGPMVLTGPCNGPIDIHLQGDLVAPTDQASLDLDHWISFRYIDRLTINGGGTFDGQGPSAWPQNTCDKDPNCKPLPISVRFDFITNSGISDITFLNSKYFHFNIFSCKNVIIQNVHIVAPDDSPNTDGIHIAKSDNIQVLNSVIGTGDDCISMGPGSKNINISNVQCGPGHGISIGSLGRSANEDDVFGVHVTNCNMTKTTNGVRIKTWGKPYQSSVSQLTFDHINFNNVDNPIIIDQQYCPLKNCEPGASGVKINDVRFSNIWGTTTTQMAVTLNCSASNPCQNIETRDINIVYRGVGGGALSYCSNAHGASYGQHYPPSCLR
ncbi:hypothetical protein ACOSP7_030275 [Xanthoceras sorbifolium]